VKVIVVLQAFPAIEFGLTERSILETLNAAAVDVQVPVGLTVGDITWLGLDVSTPPRPG